MFASDGDEPTLRLVWANDTPGQAGYVITETRIDGGRPYPALSDIAPAAFVEECEIYEQFGVRPATGREPNRIGVTGSGHAPAPSPWNWSGCTTMPPRWWRCARPPG
jgi:hypothetical protein